MAKSLSESDEITRIEASFAPNFDVSREEFRWFLRRLGITQRQFATQIGISRTYVCTLLQTYPDAPCVSEIWAKILENTLGKRVFRAARRAYKREFAAAEKARKQALKKKVQKPSN